MAVILSNLNKLHASMTTQGLSRQKFEYTAKKLTFDVFFFVDSGAPYELLFGLKGHALAFYFIVNNNYTVEDINFKPEGTFSQLYKLLEIESGDGQKFSGQTFLKDFKTHIPTYAQTSKTPEAHETSAFKKKPSDGKDIYFWRWQDNTKRGTNNTPENLEKTRRLLGADIEAMCKTKNLSSQWTSDITKKSIP